MYLRPVLPADVPAIVDLERRCFDEPWSALVFEQFTGASGFLVAIEPTGPAVTGERPPDGRLRGYVVTTRSTRWPRQVAHVRNLAVDPAVRRRGVGSDLLRASLSPYRDAGFGRVHLEVRAGNAGAIELYRGHGFEVIARHPGYYGDGEAAVVMGREIDGSPTPGR